MLITFIVLGYAILAGYIINDVRKVLKRCKAVVLRSFGKRTIYLRERKTGRLIVCSNNFFTLLLMGQ